MTVFVKRVRGASRGRYTRRQALWVRGFVLLVVFVAYALQTGTLTLQSMWLDEVMALYYTEGSFVETVKRIVQPQHNGPLFYLVLFWWRQVVGDSDLAVRFLSVIFAVLTIPLLFQWAKRLLTGRTAALSIWLFAFSPFVLWFAQEAKMYALHMLVAVASSLMLLEAFRKGGWWRWLLCALFVSTVLYSHFFGAFLIVGQVAAALLLGWHKKRRLLAYATAMLLLGLAHLPLIRFGWSLLRDYQPIDNWRLFVRPGYILRDAVGYYFYNLPVLEVPQPVFLLPAGLILVGSLLLLILWRVEAGVILLLSLAPVLAFYAASFRLPVYAAKYLSAVVPALFVLVAWTVEALSRLWRPAGLMVLALGLLMINGDVRGLTDPTVQRGDWRYVADYVDAHEGENDVVIISAHYVKYAFQRYYEGTSDVVGFEGDPFDPWPFYEWQTEQHDHMWLILHHDQVMAPGNHLREVAEAAFPVITGQFPNQGRITLLGYQTRFAYPSLPEKAQPLDVCFENRLCLVGYWIDATSLTATEYLSHPPSNWIHAVLYWRREPQVESLAFRPLVRLVDASFLVWGGNMDRRPDLFDRYPLEEWPLDGLVETHFDLNLNPVTPSGSYHLEVSLAIEGDENNRVAVVDPPSTMPPDRFLFETIQIEPEG